MRHTGIHEVNMSRSGKIGKKKGSEKKRMGGHGRKGGRARTRIGAMKGTYNEDGLRKK